MRSTKTRSAERILVDTCVLLEATDRARRQHAAARAFVERTGHLVLSAQVVREYLVVATRPVAANGFGMALGDALENVRELRGRIRLLPEERPVLPALLSLLSEVPCAGKRIHDAHLVATAIGHGVGTLATLNADDFGPFASRLKVVSPARTSP